LILTFFGLSQEYRVSLFTELHEIVTYGEGYTFTELYGMPIYLRKFIFNKIYERVQKQNKPKDLASQTEEYKGKGIKFQPPIPKANYTVPKKPGVK
jgi:hypothetical protein